MTDLTSTVADICTSYAKLGNVSRDRTFSPEQERQDAMRMAAHLNNDRGPNGWDDVTPSDFGPEHDFDIEDHGSIVIFDCYSKAALQWCYHHLPEDCPRWGAQGFAIEANFAGAVIEGARRDGLMTRDDFRSAMENEQESNRGL